MLIYFLRRMSLLFTTLLVIALLTYLFEINMIENTPYAGQFWSGFSHFIHNVLLGNFGTDLSGKPIITELARTFPATLELCFFAFLISLCVGIPVGTLAGISEKNAIGPIIITLSQFFFSIPIYWLALLAISYFSLNIGWLPVSGRINIIYEVPHVTGFMVIDSLLSDSPYRWSAFVDALKHLALPTLVLATIPTTEVIRQLSRSMSSVMKQNFIKAAATKGLSKWQIVEHHALRNALPPIFPTLGLQFGSVLTMAMVIETVFAWPGIGNWLVHSIYINDYKAISSCLLAISSFVIFASVVTDLLTATMHPLMKKALYGQ